MMKEESKDPKRIRLGEYLLGKGLISEKDLKAALKEQELTGDPLGQILIRKNLMEEIQLYQILAERLGEKFVNIFDIIIPKELISLVPENVIKKYCIIPIKREGKTLIVAMVNPKDAFAIDELRALTSLVIKPVMSSRTQILSSIEKYYKTSATKEVLEFVRGSKIEEIEAYKDEDNIDSIRRSTEEAPVIKLVNALIQDSINSRASDIHIEPTNEGCRVRFRIDGVLQELTSVSKDLYRPVASRVKILANMDITERRIPQDGSFRIEVGGKHIDVRVSTYPIIYGEKIVMRLLIREDVFLTLDEIGFEPEESKMFEALVTKPCGIILVVGPTGSGKTTTLYSILNKINSREKNIITIEDPIEYEIKGIAQSQINSKAGFTFANSLRSMMRQDPDIILVGEIRDLETAELAVRAALTGHLVFSTLHTNDSIGAVTRLIDMGIEPYLIASSLIGVLAQRLLRVNCSHCKEEVEISSSVLDRLIHSEESIKISGNKFYRGKGCEYCKNTGFLGRKGIFELLQIDDDEMRECISSGFKTATLKQMARERGFISLKENGFKKVLQGITTVEEVLRVAELG